MAALIQKVADLGKKKSEAPRHILSSSSNVSIVLEENQPDYPIEQKIQLFKNIFRGREDVQHKEFSGSEQLKILLDQETVPGRNTIIITNQDSKGYILELLEESPELFKDVRLLNIELPKRYIELLNSRRTEKSELEKTVYQADIFTIALLARHYEKGKTPFVESFLRDMLKSCMVDSDMDALLKNFDESSDTKAGSSDANTEAIVARIKLSLDRIISLVNELGRKLLLMKEFWTAA